MSTGTYAVRLTLFTDPSYEREMNTFSARMSAGSEMYFQVAMESPNATMAIYLEICYGRPFFSSDNNEKYMFIRDKLVYSLLQFSNMVNIIGSYPNSAFHKYAFATELNLHL